MKKYWLTVASIVIFAALLVYVIYVYKFKTVEQKNPQVIFQTDISKISSVVLTSKGSTMELKKVNGKYVIHIPEEVPSIQNKVLGIFQAASKIDYQEIISQKENNLAQYGFENPEAIVKINTTGGLTRTFQVGIQAPSGDGFYFKEEGQNIVYKVGSELAGQFTQGINDIANKDIFAEFDKNTADKIIVSFNEQTKTFEKKNGSWWVDGKQMKQDKTNQLMDQFKDVSVDGVSSKDKYINTSIPPILKIVVYENGIEYMNTLVIKRDENTFTVIKEGMAGVQYYVSSETYQKMRDNLVRVFQEAIAP